MATILKCKMCGGEIEVNEDMSIGTCLYCGSTMTLPRIDSDKKVRLFNRANEYRLNNEFDKAYDAYKTIIEEEPEEAEAYWGLVLSEYGIEYVEDPTSHKRIPTCHRANVTSVEDSVNYKLAIKYANAERKMFYIDEQEEIDRIQRGILAVSSKEEPYDVFICYKETNELTGERTEDSVLAQEIYDSLTEKGMRVFFSRITLEDKLGTEYEPYIYAALSTAKVMLVVGMNGNNFDAVWVKNEWSRFIKLIEEDRNKVLIPVYKDISPYEIPSKLSRFQAQDMGKIGAIQDLVRGVEKVVGVSQSENGNNDAFINSLKIEKREAEEKKKKNKKITKICLCVIGILFASFMVFVVAPNIVYAERNVEIESGIPTNPFYNSFTVRIDKDNFYDYLEIIQLDDYPEVMVVRSKYDNWYALSDGLSLTMALPAVYGSVSKLLTNVETTNGDVKFYKSSMIQNIKLENRNIGIKFISKSMLTYPFFQNVISEDFEANTPKENYKDINETLKRAIKHEEGKYHIVSP